MYQFIGVNRMIEGDKGDRVDLHMGGSCSKDKTSLKININLAKIRI